MSIESVGIIVSSITAVSVVALGFFQFIIIMLKYKIKKLPS
jgi:uncharacterized membrane protein